MTEFGTTETQEHLPSDSGLRCPTCEYNLTGVVEDRCPECGAAFDRARLLAVLAGAPAAIPIWDDSSLNPLIRFVKVCFVVWLFPGCFGRTFPERYGKRSALAFRSLVLLVTWLLLLPICLLVGRAEYLATGFACAIGVIVSEALVIWAFGTCLRPNQPRTGPALNPSASESWRGLVGFFRAFILLEAPLLTTFLATELSNQPPAWDATPAIMGVVALWWWVALGAAIAVQRASVPGRIGLVLLIPILAGLGFVIGFCVWLFAALLFFLDPFP